MGSAVGLRGEFPALDLRALARRSGDAAQLRRLLALAVICAGGTQRAGGVGGWRGVADGVGLQTAWGCRLCATGCCGSTRRVRRG